MENLFYINKVGAAALGVFGTPQECVAWVFSQEGLGDVPDNADPLELIAAYDEKYEVRPAQAALPLLLTDEEARRLCPQGHLWHTTDEDVMYWLNFTDHDVTTLRAFADTLYDRKNDVRWRGVLHKLGASPLTPDQFDQLLRQLS